MCFGRRAAKMSSTSNDTLSNLINRHSVDGVEFDLLHRTSWADAYTAYRCIKKEKASGNQASLWVRSQLQSHLYDIGSGIQRNAGKILFVGLLILAAFCIGLKSVHIENDLEKLWVEEGGRVTRELEYIRAKLDASPATFSDQIVIHTPISGASQNILRAENLLSHARMLELALQIEVELYDYAWSLEDICVKPSVPPTGLYYVDDILEKLMPCIIMTPLDCFWEGSKLLNRRNVPYVVVGNETQYLRWTYLNPVQQLIDAQSQFNDTEFSFDLMQKYVSRAGMGAGYMERPCLNPSDAGCPKSAPNAKSKSPPSTSHIAAALTGGCYGIASNFMHWHEDLIMGGIQKNRSGVIVKAEALRSIVRIMEDKEVYAHHADSHSQVNSDWTVERAREVINAWQKKFTEQLMKKAQEEEKKQQFNVFTFSALKDIVSSFSRPSTTRLVIGAAIIVVYVCSVLVNVQKPELSQAFVGFIGVVLVALSLTSGFGLCALIGLTFNVTSTQVLPFLALGLGTNGVFLLTHTLNKIVSSGSVPLEEQTGECLKRTGVNIVVSNTSLILALFAASLIPIPALRTFSLQAAVLLTFSLATVLFLFPAVFSLDLQRRASRRLDLLCCFKASEPAGEARNRRSDSATELVTGQPMRVRDEAFVKPTVSVISVVENDENELRLRKQRGIDDGCFGFSLSGFAADVYAPFIHHPAVRTIAVLSFIGLSVFGMWGVTHLEDGMQLSDLIPRQSHEYEYLIKQEKYFRFYSIFGVTQANFEYPANQRLLHEYHAAFARVGNIVKNDDGGLPDFWLSLFRDWLLGLQKTFDDELRQGFVNTEGWTANATTDAVLAYKLMVQTGRSDNPINKSQILTNRLVDRDGIIDNKAFYNYLTAWYNNDPLAYQASQAQLVPQPPHWDMIARSNELRIKKSSAIQYSQLPFYLHNVNSTKEITSIIAQLREISGKFEDRGLPNFPTGLPIVYWEQYLNLRFYMLLAIALILVTVFIMISLVLLNLAVALTIIVVLASCVCQVLGVLNALHTPLSAVPAVLVIMSIGMGVDFTLHLTMGYLTALGNKTRRVSMALEYMYAPMVHSVITTLLGIAMLAFSEFEFVIRHFSYLLSAIVVIYSYSGFVVLPVLLNLVGPQGELIPRKNLNQIDPPTPRSSPVLSSRKSSRRSSSVDDASASSSRRNSRRAALAARSDFSLSTITEEPSSYQCSSPEPEPAKIVVEPEITVETTTTTTNMCNGAVTASATTSAPSPMPSTASSGIDSRTNSPTIVTTTDVTPNGTNVTTKVTTTAKVKVEVHAPIPYIHHDYWAGRPPSRRGSRHTSDYRNSSSHYAEFNKCR